MKLPVKLVMTRKLQTPIKFGGLNINYHLIICTVQDMRLLTN